MELNETAEEGAIRETMEEAGAEVKIERLHCIYSIPHTNQVYLIFIARPANDHFNAGIESLEVRWFDETAIPWDDLAFTSNVFALQKYFINKNSSVTFIGSHHYDHRF
jgi:ADP-ribose pyrophosphatase YjhB (NUDIX family)